MKLCTCVRLIKSDNTKHDKVCKSVTGIKDHAKNFPTAPRTIAVFILMDFPRHVDRISIELPILYLKGSQVELSKFYAFLP